MAATTALAYQMMFEEKMLSAMIDSERRGVFHIAAEYASILANFVGASDLPPEPLPSNTKAENYFNWENHYFKLLKCYGKQASKTLAEVRKKYGKKPGDIPTKK